MGEAYSELMSRMKEIETVGQIQGLLGWDQEVMMPPKAAPLRAEQLAWLSTTSHSMMVDEKMGEALAAAEAEGADDEVAAGMIRTIVESLKNTQDIDRVEFIVAPMRSSGCC